ncbi:MAG: metallophosphoesterase, partial [Candidatus Dadabacteria bacterium]
PGLELEDFNPMAREAVLWTRQALREENRRYLEGLPSHPLRPEDAPDVLLTHASPREPILEYILTPRIALENFSLFSEEICLVGHTHKPAIFRWRLDRSLDGEEGAATVDQLVPEYDAPMALHTSSDERVILNPGSVGQPRDSDPRAAYGILDLEARIWTVRRVSYPIDLTQSQMRAAKLPRRLIDRLNYGW